MDAYFEKLEEHRERISLCFEQRRYSYAELLDRIAFYQKELGHIPLGSVVSLISDYSFDAISMFFALIKRQAILAPIVSDNVEEIARKEQEIMPDFTIEVSSSGSISVTPHQVMPDRHELIQRIRDNFSSGLILFSSGSTGAPKAMIHDLDVLMSTYLERRAKALSIMVFLMFDHIGGLNTLLNSLAMGAKIVIPSKREPEHVGKLIEQEKVNLLPASPSFLNMMLIANVQETYNLKTLRMVTYGTEAMPESLLGRLKKALPKVKLLQTFGTSETGIAQTSSRSSSSLEIRIEDPNQEYKIVNGELWLRSKTQILGYLNHDMNSFSDDGWFQTGDLVEEHSDGYLRIVGRLKEVINVGGEKVLPSEVESCILEVEGIVDCVVYSLVNAITGQTVGASVVLASGFDEKTVKKSIRKHCKAMLDSYKVPTKLVFGNDVGISTRFKKNRLSKYE